MLPESGVLTKYSSVRYSERRKQVKCRAWGQESVIISVIARVRNSGSLFRSFLYVFCRGDGSCPHSWGVRNSEVSARREATVYVQEIQASLLKKMLNVRYCLNCLTRDVQ